MSKSQIGGKWSANPLTLKCTCEVLWLLMVLKYGLNVYTRK